MPVYEYTAIDLKGKHVSGIIDAESDVVARQKLRTSNTFPVSVKTVHDTAGKKEPFAFILIRPFTRIRPVEVSMMTRQLATVVGAGFPLVSAIETLIPQTKSHAFKRILARIRDLIVEGNSFANALSRYPGIFSPLYINMVHAGETSGTLEIVLERLAEITEKQHALKNRIRTVLIYPIFMSFLGVILLLFLMTFIVPNITSIFSDMDQVLPAPTRFLIVVSDLLKSFWWLIFAMIGLIIFAVRGFKKTKQGQLLMDKTVLMSPIIGPIIKKLAVARFSRTLGSLLENGVSMLPALYIVKNIAGNVLISEAVEASTEEVSRGVGLGNAMAATKIFPQLSIQMIQVGEQSGELETMLDKIADVYENEVETTVMNLTSLLEPVMILFMGIVVGFIVLSICLPIFEMNQLIV